MPTRLAIVIPTYNAAAFITYTVDSIQNQLCTLETATAVFIADDCSTDDTIELARAAWRVPIPLCALKGSSNAGECENVNRSFAELAKLGYDFVLLLHQDDLLLPGWLEVVSHEIANLNPEVGFLCCHSTYYAGLGAPTEELQKVPPPIPGPAAATYHQPGDTSARALSKRWFWNISGTVFRVAAYCAIGGMHPELRFVADNDLIVRMLLGGYGIMEYDVVGLCKRGHPGSSTSVGSQRGLDIPAWLYLIHRYHHLRAKKENRALHLSLARSVLRRTVPFARRGGVNALFTQSRCLVDLGRSYFALESGRVGWLPAGVRRLLRHRHEPLIEGIVARESGTATSVGEGEVTS